MLKSPTMYSTVLEPKRPWELLWDFLNRRQATAGTFQLSLQSVLIRFSLQTALDSKVFSWQVWGGTTINSFLNILLNLNFFLRPNFVPSIFLIAKIFCLRVSRKYKRCVRTYFEIFFICTIMIIQQAIFSTTLFLERYLIFAELRNSFCPNSICNISSLFKL